MFYLFDNVGVTKLILDQNLLSKFNLDISAIILRSIFNSV